MAPNLLHGGRGEGLGGIRDNSQIFPLSNSSELTLGGQNKFWGKVVSWILDIMLGYFWHIR